MDELAASALINLINETVSEEIQAALVWANGYKLMPENGDMSVYTLACLVYLHEVVKGRPFRVGELLGNVLECFNVREVDNLLNSYLFPVEQIYVVVKKWECDNRIPTLFDLKFISHQYKLLHYAAFHGHLPMVQWLIERDVIIDMTDSTGKTALHLAAVRGHRDVLLMLLTKGASVLNRDEYGKTPFELALDAEKFDSTELLSPQIFSNMWYSDGECIVFKMIREQKEEQVKYLLNFVNITKTNCREETLFHTAAYVGNLKILDELIRRSFNHPGLINSVDMRNWTPLAVAVHHRYIQTSKMLINAGAEINNDIIEEALLTNNLPFLHLINYTRNMEDREL